MNLLEHLRKCKEPISTHRNNSISTRLPSIKANPHHSEHGFERTPNRPPASPKSFSKYARWDSLPPIYELKRSKILDLQPKTSEVIENLLLSKHEVSLNRSHSHRNKTEMAVNKKKYLLSHRSSNSINFDDIRMKPVDKYYKRLDNIRMAERLLTIKPSPGLKRDTLKKFYL